MEQAGFIGIDQGSSSTKALILDASGAVLFRDRRDLAAPLREGPKVEQDPAEIFRSVQEVLFSCAKYAGSAGFTLLGIGLSCQRSSCLMWSESTGEPLSPVLSWRDRRGRDLIRRISGSNERVFEKTGLPLTPYYAASKFRWLKEHLPADVQDAPVFGTLSSFLVQRLTQGKRAVIDHTNAARTQLMNIQELAWDEELTALFGLSGIRLPELCPTNNAFGLVRTPGGAVPLFACVGDQQAAMIGLGVLQQGDGGINYGTGGFLMVSTGQDLVRAQSLMSSVLYSTQAGNQYLLEGSVNAVGDSLEWLRTRFGLFTRYEEVDDLCRKAATDVVAFIGLNGTGAPHWEPDISSALHGLTAESTAADIVRGTVENVAFFMNDIAGAIKAAGIEPLRYSLSGGLSSLSCLVQAQADLLKKELRLSSEQEVSARGAALLAGMQQGMWSSGKLSSMAPAGESATGRENPGLERRYCRWRELHRMAGILDRI